MPSHAVQADPKRICGTQSATSARSKTRVSASGLRARAKRPHLPPRIGKLMRHLLLVFLLPTWPVQATSFDAAAMLAAHNQWRAKVGTPPLTYSPALAKSAQRWADQLQAEHQCRLRHSQSDGKYGENLYWAGAIRWSDGRRAVQPVSPQQVVAAWGSESKDYHHERNACTPGQQCGHYTQVVWQTTSRVGCAVAVCPDTSEQVWVCQYQAPGNWVGKKPY